MLFIIKVIFLYETGPIRHDSMLIKKSWNLQSYENFTIILFTNCENSAFAFVLVLASSMNFFLKIQENKILKTLMPVHMMNIYRCTHYHYRYQYPGGWCFSTRASITTKLSMTMHPVPHGLNCRPGPCEGVGLKAHYNRIWSQYRSTLVE